MLNMPVIEIKLWEGNTEDQKEKIIKGVTNVLTDVLGIEPTAATVLIYDIPKCNWGTGGKTSTRL